MGLKRFVNPILCWVWHGRHNVVEERGWGLGALGVSKCTRCGATWTTKAFYSPPDESGRAMFLRKETRRHWSISPPPWSSN